MAGSEDLNIVLKLQDQASAQLKSAMGDAGKEADKVNKQSDKATKSITDNFKEAGKQMKDFRKAAFAVTMEIGFIIVATKEWANHNIQTKSSMDSLGISIKNITALIGSMFGPAIIQVARLLEAVMPIFTKMFEGFQKLYTGLFRVVTFVTQFQVAFTSAMSNGSNMIDAFRIATEVATKATADLSKQFASTFEENLPQADAARMALENYKKTQQDLELLFKSGQISAQEYFNATIAGQQQVIDQNVIIAEQMRGYIDLATEVSNSELMSFQAAMQGRMDLLNTYKTMYMQGHADMFAFGNMLANEFHANMSNALSSIILGEAKASDAFKAFGQAMVKAVVDYMVQQAVAFAISKVMQGIILATTGALATSLAIAWAPAAALASLATMGANAAPAMSGMAITTATAYALAVPKAMAQGGEGVVNKPTLFLAGEAGAERYRFTPLWKEGSGSSAGKQTINHISVTIHNPVVREEGDIDKIVEAVSNKIAWEAERI